jgi:hypothetical protein
MPERIKKEEFVRRLAARMNADETTATAWVDGVIETLYESFNSAVRVVRDILTRVLRDTTGASYSCVLAQDLLHVISS